MSTFRRCRLLHAADPAELQPVPLRAKGSPPPAAPGPLPDGQEPGPDRLTQRLAELERTAAESAREAYQRGLREGEAAARARLEKEHQETAGRLAQAIQQLAARRSEVLRRAEVDVLRLSVEIARRVLHRELAVDATALEGLIRVALQKLDVAELVRVRAHPDHAAAVRTCLERAGAPPNIEVVSDAGQPRGGTIFELHRGNLDASLETQLREIERGLTDRFESRSHERPA